MRIKIRSGQMQDVANWLNKNVGAIKVTYNAHNIDGGGWRIRHNDISFIRIHKETA